MVDDITVKNWRRTIDEIIEAGAKLETKLGTLEGANLVKSLTAEKILGEMPHAVLVDLSKALGRLSNVISKIDVKLSNMGAEL